MSSDDPVAETPSPYTPPAGADPAPPSAEPVKGSAAEALARFEELARKMNRGVLRSLGGATVGGVLLGLSTQMHRGDYFGPGAIVFFVGAVVLFLAVFSLVCHGGAALVLRFRVPDFARQVESLSEELRQGPLSPDLQRHRRFTSLLIGGGVAVCFGGWLLLCLIIRQA